MCFTDADWSLCFSFVSVSEVKRLQIRGRAGVQLAYPLHKAGHAASAAGSGFKLFFEVSEI